MPDDFFVGIGDINSTFLPKVEPLTAPGLTTPARKGAQLNQPPPSLGLPQSSPAGLPTDGDVTNPTLEEVEQAERRTKALLTQNTLALEAQLEERPLAKKQVELQEASVEGTKDVEKLPLEKAEGTPSAPEPAKPEHAPRKALLKNDDQELIRIGKVCNTR